MKGTITIALDEYNQVHHVTISHPEKTEGYDELFHLIGEKSIWLEYLDDFLIFLFTKSKDRIQLLYT